jgi:hypothetical protein
MKQVCLYFHINPLKNEIFYVGIGSASRPYNKTYRSVFWKNIVKKYGLIVDIVETNLTWEKAQELERFYIKKIGRRDKGLGPLVNMQDGGEGGRGQIHSDESKKKASEAMKGKIFTDEHKLNLSKSRVKQKAPFSGKKHSEETRLKMKISFEKRIKKAGNPVSN